MPLAISEIKTAKADKAVNRIKSMVRRDGLGLKFDIPENFIEKRKYMQSNEFLKDEHNIKMFGLLDTMMELRDKITEEIAEKNKTAKDEIVQGINGLSRIKKYLDENFKMNFSDVQTFHSPAENQYNILKKYQIGNTSIMMKNQLNKIG